MKNFDNTQNKQAGSNNLIINKKIETSGATKIKIS